MREKKKSVAAVALGGIIIFLWGWVSWTVLPWHQSVANEFADEAAVAEAIAENASKSGVYYLPFRQEDHKKGEAAAFVNALPSGYDVKMSSLMVSQLIGNWIAALILFWLLSRTTGLDYWDRVGFITVIGVAVGFVSHYPYWNWFGFPAAYVAVVILDIAIAMFLAGLLMAKLVRGKSPGSRVAG